MKSDIMTELFYNNLTHIAVHLTLISLIATSLGILIVSQTYKVSCNVMTQGNIAGILVISGSLALNGVQLYSLVSGKPTFHPEIHDNAKGKIQLPL